MYSNNESLNIHFLTTIAKPKEVQFSILVFVDRFANTTEMEQNFEDVIWSMKYLDK